ncbi:hypothetical protein [Fimbriimonas ginsengisoli]|uniref:Rhs family protein-like protein n=1 Tax=Fimbriimonas ginsengisoli Gsoil 348 TaxID=661478 RepID=A0A068NV78_FIMGI|nr:hypothetical protein [Fimbriimonas ginsengisoli]AIE87277.1 Rhs family protein-like protein [Fimbriimonas ginsengisoli Gsoil 348]
MPVTNYYTVRSEILGESSSGASRNYLRDALGSVVAMADTANTKSFTGRYKPYGGVLVTTGTEPSFTWVGVLGYLRAAGSAHNEFSVRARFYGHREGIWCNLDPIIVPEVCAANASVAVGVEVYEVRRLLDAIEILSGSSLFSPHRFEPSFGILNRTGQCFVRFPSLNNLKPMRGCGTLPIGPGTPSRASRRSSSL